jgi:hypothetical protein
MSNIFTPLLGTSLSRLGANQVLGPTPPPTPPSGCPTLTGPTDIVPNTGLTVGGTPFVITGDDVAYTGFDDAFNLGFLNLTEWQIIGPNTPIVRPVGPNGTVQIQTGTSSGTYAGLLNLLLQPLADFHVEISFFVQNAYLSSQPATEVTLAAIDAFIDTNNWQRLSLVVKGPTATQGTLRSEVWVAGEQIHLLEVPFTANSGTLGLMRYLDPIEDVQKAVFWLNGMKVTEFFDAPAGEMSIRFFAWNEGSSYNVQTNFNDFISHSIIIFEDQTGCDVATNVVEVTSSRIRGNSPPTFNNWAGPVTIIVSNGSGLDCRATGMGYWTYSFPPAYIVGQSSPGISASRVLSFTNDPILRNPNPVNVGLGLGRQF